MEIGLHVGVHKTATTYLQKTLEANQAGLRSAGMAYVPLDEVRSTMTARLKRRFSGLPRAAQALADRHDGCKRLLLSDENLIGLCGHAVRDGSYYASAEQRVRRLVRAFRGHDVRIFIATRSYDAFVSSIYCEFIRYYPFLTPDEYLRAIDVERLDWCKLIGGLCQVVGEDHVAFWRFEDFDQIEDRVLSMMTGEKLDWEKPSGVVHQSLSQKAVDSLSTLRPALRRGEIQSRVSAVAHDFPKGPDNPEFRAFGDSRAAQLQSRYLSDMERLRSAYPRLREIAHR
jgi:hypothetical protein